MGQFMYIVVLVVVLMLFGAPKLPEFARAWASRCASSRRRQRP